MGTVSITAKRRFEFSAGSSHKFWEIDTKGSSHTVTYGRVGTSGQTKVKDLGTPAKARAAAERLIESKVKKGYSEGKLGNPAKKAKASKAASAKAKSAKTPARTSKAKANKGEAKLVHVVEEPYPKGAIVALWEDGKDLWFVGNEHKKKPEDEKLRDFLNVQRQSIAFQTRTSRVLQKHAPPRSRSSASPPSAPPTSFVRPSRPPCSACKATAVPRQSNPGR